MSLRTRIRDWLLAPSPEEQARIDQRIAESKRMIEALDRARDLMWQRFPTGDELAQQVRSAMRKQDGGA